jgi:hypothetical protein
MFSPHAADLTEPVIKELRAVCKLEDKEDNDAVVQRLHLSTRPLKKDLQMADEFVEHLFQKDNITDSVRNSSTR